MISQRIKKLREQSINAKPYVSSERAQLITEFYENDEAQRVSNPVKRALAFKYMMENSRIFLCYYKNGLLIAKIETNNPVLMEKILMAN